MWRQIYFYCVCLCYSRINKRKSPSLFMIPWILINCIQQWVGWWGRGHFRNQHYIFSFCFCIYFLAHSFIYICHEYLETFILQYDIDKYYHVKSDRQCLDKFITEIHWFGMVKTDNSLNDGKRIIFFKYKLVKEGRKKALIINCKMIDV